MVRVVEGMIHSLPPPNEEVIEMLEEWLIQAREGHIQSMALVAEMVFKNEDGSGVCTQFSVGPRGSVAELVWGLELAKLRIMGFSED